jgi:hypothetical protein
MEKRELLLLIMMIMLILSSTVYTQPNRALKALWMLMDGSEYLPF